MGPNTPTLQGMIPGSGVLVLGGVLVLVPSTLVECQLAYCHKVTDVITRKQCSRLEPLLVVRPHSGKSPKLGLIFDN